DPRWGPTVQPLIGDLPAGAVRRRGPNWGTPCAARYEYRYSSLTKHAPVTVIYSTFGIWTGMKFSIPAISALALGLALGACSTPSAESLAQNDPWEKTNRDIFDFDVRVDRSVARPIAKGYRAVVPEPVRDGIHNALTNLNSPVVLANDVL